MLGSETRQDCNEFAVVAFWDLDKTDVFVCNRFFIIPSPFKRSVMDAKGTSVHQVLFTSEHTKDVFFFWRGVEMSLVDDLTHESDDSLKSIEMQIGFLNLNLTDTQIQEIGEERLLSMHCSEIQTIKEGTLVHKFLTDLNEQPVKD